MLSATTSKNSANESNVTLRYCQKCQAHTTTVKKYPPSFLYSIVLLVVSAILSVRLFPRMIILILFIPLVFKKHFRKVNYCKYCGTRLGNDQAIDQG